ncbi:glycosyltransferase family 2 protein [Desertivirga xinjiangensis]|uniref:glycosyltransferase family 2 protein n=1 Tax=Desertivirga xinjiangensis TaxID=539206 RepID=UPI00210A184D|nr:glycosyltransferase family 2 protein [Pedobacter xinjiangensis]
MKISIVTVTFNAESFLRDCISSVMQQSYPNLEYIIVDGRSTDNTINIIKSYEHQINRFLSESDQGMYDALNKGINMATGDIVGLLNADDFFASPDVVSSIAEKISKTDADVLYGDLWYVDQQNTDRPLRKWRSKPYKHGMFQWGWMPAHPTFYAKRELFEKYGNYRLDLGSACDYELMIRFMHKYKLKSVYLPKLMVKMRAGGMSNSSLENRRKANEADLKAMKINGIKFPRLAAFLKPVRKIPQFLGI